MSISNIFIYKKQFTNTHFSSRVSPDIFLPRDSPTTLFLLPSIPLQSLSVLHVWIRVSLLSFDLVRLFSLSTVLPAFYLFKFYHGSEVSANNRYERSPQASVVNIYLIPNTDGEMTSVSLKKFRCLFH